ncbi:MAG: hypothetical protein ACXQS2_01485 [Methermicoccaceae archaeon]
MYLMVVDGKKLAITEYDVGSRKMKPVKVLEEFEEEVEELLIHIYIGREFIGSARNDFFFNPRLFKKVKVDSFESGHLIVELYLRRKPKKVVEEDA